MAYLLLSGVMVAITCWAVAFPKKARRMMSAAGSPTRFAHRLNVLAGAVVFLGASAIAASAQNAPDATPRPPASQLPNGFIDPEEWFGAVVAYAEMSCTQLGAALQWQETRAVPQQIAAWKRAMDALPPRDPRAATGEYLLAIEVATVKALRELLLYDVLSMAGNARKIAAEAVDRGTYLIWIRTSRGDALDELARRVAQSLGLTPGTGRIDLDSPQGRDLVRRRAVAHAERMRVEGVFRSPMSTLALMRVEALLGPAQKVAAVGDYLARVLAAVGPLVDAHGVAIRDEAQVAARARELSGMMREGERMRLAFAIRCGDEPRAEVVVLGAFSGRFESPFGTIDFSPDGSYVHDIAFGVRVSGHHRIADGRVYLTNWQQGREQWFSLRGECLLEAVFGKEMFCRGRMPRW